MNEPSAKEQTIQQLKNRMGEVAEHRAARWLDELNKEAQRSAKEKLMERMDEVTDMLAARWLRELDARLKWSKYREEHDDFCYGVGFGEREACQPSDERDTCPHYEYCKAEYEAERPEKKS